VIAQVRAELLKIRSTRTTVGLVLGMVALALLFGLLAGLLTKAGHLGAKEEQRSLLTDGSVAGIFAALAGVLLVTSEFRFGTIRPTFLFTPRRWRVIAAKVVASMLAGLVFGVIAEAIALVVGYVTLDARGIPFVLDAHDLVRFVPGTVAGVVLWGGIGVGVGAVVRNQVGAVIGLLAWGFIVENLLFAFVPSIGRFTPGEAQNALMGLTTRHLLAQAAGGGVLVAWTVAVAALAVAATARRDVS